MMKRQPPDIDDMQARAMTAEEFQAALNVLMWKPADFSRMTEVHRNTVSRWTNNLGPIPGWVPRFLSMAIEIKRLSRLVEPQKLRKDD